MPDFDPVAAAPVGGLADTGPLPPTPGELDISEQTAYAVMTVTGLAVSEQTAYAVLANSGFFITEQTAYVVMLPGPANTRRRQVMLGSF